MNDEHKMSDLSQTILILKCGHDRFLPWGRPIREMRKRSLRSRGSLEAPRNHTPQSTARVWKAY